MDYAEWANKNKKQIAREFIRKIDHESAEKPSGIFMAGLPGTGKAEFTVELIKSFESEPLRIDMDEIAQMIEGYRPEIADKFRGGASKALDLAMKRANNEQKAVSTKAAVLRSR